MARWVTGVIESASQGRGRYRLEMNLLRTQLTARNINGSAWLGVGRDMGAPSVKASFREVTGGFAAVGLWHDNEPNGVPGAMEFAARFDANTDMIDENIGSQFNLICECDGEMPIKPFDWQ